MLMAISLALAPLGTSVDRFVVFGSVSVRDRAEVSEALLSVPPKSPLVTLHDQAAHSATPLL